MLGKVVTLLQLSMPEKNGIKSVHKATMQHTYNHTFMCENAKLHRETNMPYWTTTSKLSTGAEALCQDAMHTVYVKTTHHKMSSVSNKLDVEKKLLKAHLTIGEQGPKNASRLHDQAR